jgi:hypothetical protein
MSKTQTLTVVTDSAQVSAEYTINGQVQASFTMNRKQFDSIQDFLPAIFEAGLRWLSTEKAGSALDGIGILNPDFTHPCSVCGYFNCKCAGADRP